MSMMVPMYGFGGGIDNLRFRVYAATSLPASGKENDVCIITSTPIPSWEAGQVDNPTWSMDAGFVYLTCSASDASQPNLLRRNALFLKLTRCWQYESGKWATKNAYQYRNGAWVQFSTTFRATIHVTYPAGFTCTATDGATTLTAPDTSGTWDCVVPNAGTWTVSLDNKFAETVNVTTSDVMYTVDKWNLYNDGNQYTSITGGWVGEHTRSGYTASGGYLTVNNDNLLVKNVAGGSFSAATKNTVDLSKFNTLHVTYIGCAHVCVAGTFPTSSFSAKAEGGSVSSKTEITVNISSLTGSYRIGIVDANAATTKVYKVWMT